MTMKTKITSLFAILVTGIVVGITSIPEADAAVCFESSGNHCYAIGALNNVGGTYGNMNINAGNYVESGKGIANALWIVFDNGDWLEIGWQKGDMVPCNDTTASWYYYYKKGAVRTGSCLGNTSGSTDTFQISDANEDYTWQVKMNGLTKLNINMGDNVGDASSGGESTDDDNSLDNGKVANQQYYDPTSNTWEYWDSSAFTSNDDPPYDAFWGTPSYETLKYEDT